MYLLKIKQNFNEIEDETFFFNSKYGIPTYSQGWTAIVFILCGGERGRGFPGWKSKILFSVIQPFIEPL